jgi:hypothetical protein
MMLSRNFQGKVASKIPNKEVVDQPSSGCHPFGNKSEGKNLSD